MAGAKQTVDDYSFLITCLLHTNPLPRPDFAAVAVQLGMKSADAAYKRHWSIMNKLRKNASAVAGHGDGDTGMSGEGSKKAPRKKSVKRKVGDGDDSGEEAGKGSKKVKHQEVDEVSNSEVV